MNDSARLPQSFLRGLEADLRALCADARRRNPDVKHAAESVILSLKEADTPEAESEATDQAASVFCAACDPPDHSLSTNALAVHTKVSLRAVTCLHKLLTHRALSPHRLPQVLDALQSLGRHCFDDNITLKVLQGLLSLLTVRSYAKSLSEQHLSRSFSLLFILRTSRSNPASNPATNALSAISHMSAATDVGVIEQTSKAAFRQVSSDLFASAADAAVRTAVERQAPSGEFIPLSVFPSEARAAFSLFIDLCNAASGDAFEWLTHTNQVEVSKLSGLDLGLALEVIDDGLSSNIALFAGQPVFSDALSGRLCPVIHKLLRTTRDKPTLKSLLGLVVTVVRNYWRNLKPDSEALLYALAKMSSPQDSGDPDQNEWGSVYAMESLRCIFRFTQNEPNVTIDFVQAFDLGDGSGRAISGVVSVACDVIATIDTDSNDPIPSMPVSGTMKPFANTILNTRCFLVAIATGLYIDVVKSAEESIRRGDLKDVAKALLPSNMVNKAAELFGKMINERMKLDVHAISSGRDETPFSALDALTRSLGRIAVISDVCEMDTVREKTFSTLAHVCRNCIRFRVPGGDLGGNCGQVIFILYDVLFDVVSKCQETLGRQWLPVVDALEDLDALLHKIDSFGDSEATVFSSTASTLRSKLNDLMCSTTNLKWSACHDMISALVQSSRQSIAGLLKRAGPDDIAKVEVDPSMRVFGITSAEKAILNAFKRSNTVADVMPSTLWDLLVGHLTSVCSDSIMFSLRIFALNSLTRIACGAVLGGNHPIIAHDKIISPFLDLFTSSHPDVRSGALSSVYTVLETQGERLTGEAAWRAVLLILSSSVGAKTSKVLRETGDRNQNIPMVVEHKVSQTDSNVPLQGVEMVSDGFKVVQVIADDFMSAVAKNSLSIWVDVLGLYSRQVEDINVSLTSIGLLWRTADFLAKSTSFGKEDELWVELFQILKEVSMDERPEVRNCAVKTLTGALSAHSFRLSALAWNGCVANVLLPLLEEVMQGGVVAVQSDENSSGGKGRSDVQLLLHHSRDTPRKQWNETRVLALAGVAKVLRTAMPRLAVLQDESRRPLFLMLSKGGTKGLWRKMLRAAGVAAASRDGEVAVAGVSALLELLSAAGFVVEDQPIRDQVNKSGIGSSLSAPAVLESSTNGNASSSWMSGVMGVSDVDNEEVNSEKSRTLQVDSQKMDEEGRIILWEAVWSALAEAIGGQEVLGGLENADFVHIGKSKIVDEHALQMLAEGLIEARKKLGAKFTPSSSKMLVQVLMFLALGHREIEEDEVKKDNGTSRSGLTEVQEVTLFGLKRLSFEGDNESWVRLIQGLLVIVNDPVGLRDECTLTKRVLEIITSIYVSTETPSVVKSDEVRRVVIALGKIMLSREEKFGQMKGTWKRHRKDENMKNGEIRYGRLWRDATEVMIIAMKHGTEALDERHGDGIWVTFVGLMEQFLYRERLSRYQFEYSQDTRERKEREEYDIKLADCVKEAIFHMGSEASVETKRRLVKVLSRGAEEGEANGRPRFVRACQKKLFSLADMMGSSEEGEERNIAEESGKHVVKTCGRVLGQFIADGQRAGRCPLPAGRRAEAVFLLQQLRGLGGGRRDGPGKKHVLTLYPRLCECVESRDEAVRLLARKLLDETAPVASDVGTKVSSGIALAACSDALR